MGLVDHSYGTIDIYIGVEIAGLSYGMLGANTYHPATLPLA